MSPFATDRSTIPALDRPETSESRQVRRWNARKAAGQVAEVPDGTLPGLDLVGMRQRYSPDRAHEPRQYEATFQAPLGMPTAHFEALAKAAVGKWINVMNKRGWDLTSEVRVRPGVYPAFDIGARVPLLDQREFIITASFACRQPRLVRLELPSEMFQPVRLGGRH